MQRRTQFFITCLDCSVTFLVPSRRPRLPLCSRCKNTRETTEAKRKKRDEEIASIVGGLV